MNDVPGHRWEVRHGDATDLLSRIATLRCVDCDSTLLVRQRSTFRQFSFRDREALEQAWEVHVKEHAQKKFEQRLIEREKELLPY